ncbi:MAG: hypothetical protein H6936_15070 [Burkholderiales bacterium]|nr:hypothetical protein [Nitrosomonas sp.]MCP5276133.1 hypothetical protein [Burkholderiales bacterium]
MVKPSCLRLQGNTLTLALLTRGNIIGHLQNDTGGQALGKVICFRIGHDDFRQLIFSQADLAWLVFESMNIR